MLRHLQSNGSQGYEWKLLSRDPESFATQWPDLASLPSTTWHRGDVLHSTQDLRSPLTHFVHAAADSTSAVCLSDVQRFDQIVEGTRRMLDLAVACGARRFLFTSSGGVYGRQPSELAGVPEDYLGIPDPLNASNVYSVAKRAAEHLCALYAKEHGLEIVIARCFSFVGQDLPLNTHFAIGNFIRDALWADEIIVYGDGTPIRSYLDQQDLARWLLTLLKEGKSGEAYNVGSDRTISITDLAHLVRDLVSPGKRVHVVGKPENNTERNRYVPDISKIKRHLGLQPVFSLETSIRATADTARNRASIEKSRFLNSQSGLKL